MELSEITTMRLSEIKKAMRTWSDQRNQAGLIKMASWLNQGNMFDYNRDPNNTPIPPAQEAFIHAYPGIVNENGVDVLYFFVISACYDNSSTPNIENCIQACKIATGSPSQTGQSGDIPVQEALDRINNWDNNLDTWITDNIGTTNSIFQAFVIPQLDSSVGTTHHSFFALKVESTAPSGYVADLIIEDVDGATFTYFDMVRPVPPFGGGATAESRFYLLSLIEGS